MKKKGFLIILMFLGLMLVGCSKKDFEITEMDANQIVQRFQEAGLPIDNIIVYDEETDVNGLLGRPGQYTSKVNFADTRCEQWSDSDPVGGTIEVFENSSDSSDRNEYLGSYDDLHQYMYLYKNILFRLDYDLTPSQAEQYEEVFKNLQEGKLMSLSESELQTDSDEEMSEDSTESINEETEAAKSKNEIIDFCADEGRLKYIKHELLENWEGNPAIAVYFEYTNFSDKSKTVMEDFYVDAFQNGVQCDRTFPGYKMEEDDNTSKEIQKGATLSVCMMYKIQDEKADVSLEASCFGAYDIDDQKQTLKISDLSITSGANEEKLKETEDKVDYITDSYHRISFAYPDSMVKEPEEDNKVIYRDSKNCTFQIIYTPMNGDSQQILSSSFLDGIFTGLEDLENYNNIGTKDCNVDGYPARLALYTFDVSGTGYFNYLLAINTKDAVYAICYSAPALVVDVDEFNEIATEIVANISVMEAAETSTNSSVSDSKGNDSTSSVTETETETEQETETTGQTEYVEKVWIPNSGSKYHRTSSCSNMDSPREVSKAEAERMGYTPCKRCY